MKRFSEREGFAPVRDKIQVGEMSDELRRQLWNILTLSVWREPGFTDYSGRGKPRILGFGEFFRHDFLKQAIDTLSGDPDLILGEIRDYFFTWEWSKVYDFVEWTVQVLSVVGPLRGKINISKMKDDINHLLSRELAGYRFVDLEIAPITDEQEVRLLEATLQNEDLFPGVREHLAKALDLLSDKNSPDYRNSIKESISAVESMAKGITGLPGADLAKALRHLEKKRQLHSALKEGWAKLYGYTSDADGIRHGMLDGSAVGPAEAKYFLLSCTSFINYLKSKFDST